MCRLSDDPYARSRHGAAVARETYDEHNDFPPLPVLLTRFARVFGKRRHVAGLRVLKDYDRNLAVIIKNGKIWKNMQIWKNMLGH